MIKNFWDLNSYLISEYGIKRIGLFGSYSKNQQTKDSDIDIVAEFEKPIGLKFVEFTEYLEKVLGKKTDVVTPEGIKGITFKKISEELRLSLHFQPFIILSTALSAGTRISSDTFTSPSINSIHLAISSRDIFFMSGHSIVCDAGKNSLSGLAFFRG